MVVCFVAGANDSQDERLLPGLSFVQVVSSAHVDDAR